MKNIFNNFEILSPVDQFEIRNLISVDAPVLLDLHISLTNIGLYLFIGTLVVITTHLLATNYNKITPNN